MTHSNIPSSSSDLTEAMFAELLSSLRAPSISATPRQLVISLSGLAFARDLALRDPEFARRVREEFPDLADGLLGTSS